MTINLLLTISKEVKICGESMDIFWNYTFWRLFKNTQMHVTPNTFISPALPPCKYLFKKASSGYLDNLLAEILIYCNLLHILFSVVQGENDERNKKRLSSSKGKSI